jgi:signal transduction histidine kinase
MSIMFLRVYGTLIMTISGIVVFCLLSLSLIRYISLHEYWEQDLGRPLQVLNSGDMGERFRQSLQHGWVEQAGLGTLNSYERYRLLRGRVITVLDDSDMQFRFLSGGTSSPDASLLSAYPSSVPNIDDLSRVVSGAVVTFYFDGNIELAWAQFADLIRHHYQVSGMDAISYEQWLAEQLTVPVRLAVMKSAPTYPVSSRLVDVRLGDNYHLMIGPLNTPRQTPAYTWLILGLMAVLVLALVVFWLVTTLESGLRNLDQVTGRLAQGHLSARIAVTGVDPVNRLGSSFNKMAEHIQRLIDIQREMLRAVSHELRTPVARLRFGLQIIEDEVESPYLKQQIQGMDTDIQELDQLIDEILTYARLEEGGPLLEFHEVVLTDIARQVAAEARPPAHIEVLFLETERLQNTLVEVEPRYIHRAVQNLVSNACRYAHSRVQVRCSVAVDTCRIDVEDDGPGIPEAEWPKVFVAFARLDDSRTRSSGGYGLGLSIVRRIAYWHGGRAIVGRSEQLGGARFSLIWPRYHMD